MMKNIKTSHILTAILMLGFFMMPMLLLADDPGLDPDAPIDGGVSLLLAAGAAYGVKKYREHKKKGTGEESEK